MEKRNILAILGAAAVLCFTGCARQEGSTVINIDTANSPDPASIKASDFSDSLPGLEKYFAALNYIPEKTEPSTMMYKVIGAVDGDKFTFTVNGKSVSVELYEYDPDNLSEQAVRVMKEIKEEGKFRVLESDDNIKVEAVLSEDKQFLMIYQDSSDSEENVKRKNNVKDALIKFQGESKKSSSEVSESSSESSGKASESSDESTDTDNTESDSSEGEDNNAEENERDNTEE